MNNTLRLTSSSRYVVDTRLHLLELLRLDISLCSRRNLLPLLRLFYPDVFQSAHHVETVVPASCCQGAICSRLNLSTICSVAMATSVSQMWKISSRNGLNDGMPVPIETRHRTLLSSGSGPYII